MTRYLSCAETAKLVRTELKRVFPHNRFSVRSHLYAGGASIRVEYLNGPAVEAVETVVKKFEGASFDSSIDLKSYNYTVVEGEKIQYGSDYVNVTREIDTITKEKVASMLATTYRVSFISMDSIPNINNRWDNWHQLVWAYCRNRSIEEIHMSINGGVNRVVV